MNPLNHSKNKLVNCTDGCASLITLQNIGSSDNGPPRSTAVGFAKLKPLTGQPINKIFAAVPPAVRSGCELISNRIVNHDAVTSGHINNLHYGRLDWRLAVLVDRGENKIVATFRNIVFHNQFLVVLAAVSAAIDKRINQVVYFVKNYFAQSFATKPEATHA